MIKYKSPRPLTEWTNRQLKTILTKKKTPEEIKDHVRMILKDRKVKGLEFGKQFFSLSNNRFYLLAMYQLYREGKTKTYSDGKQRKFYYEGNPVDIIDKMVEIRSKYDVYLRGKTDKDFETWKR